jgi:uncharacterized protein (TIGR03437 family)
MGKFVAPNFKRKKIADMKDLLKLVIGLVVLVVFCLQLTQAQSRQIGGRDTVSRQVVETPDFNFGSQAAPESVKSEMTARLKPQTSFATEAVIGNAIVVPTTSYQDGPLAQSELASAFIAQNSAIPVKAFQYAADGTIPTTLGGVRVRFVDGAFAPVLYISPTQINFQVPQGSRPGLVYTVEITTPSYNGDVVYTAQVAINLANLRVFQMLPSYDYAGESGIAGSLPVAAAQFQINRANGTIEYIPVASATRNTKGQLGWKCLPFSLSTLRSGD